MLQSKCKHSNGLPLETCSYCNSQLPDSLLNICFDYINNHLDTICVRETDTERLSLRKNVALPEEICEKLLTIRASSVEEISKFINIFKDLECTRLKRVRICNSDINDSDLKLLLKHRLIELDISNCPYLTYNCLFHISTHGLHIQSLSIGDNPHIFSPFKEPKFLEVYYKKGYIFVAPSLRKLSLKGVQNLPTQFFTLLLANFPELTHLDLSNCNDLKEFDFITKLTNLTSLILYNVSELNNKVPLICNLKQLRHLDLSQAQEESGKYENGDALLAAVVENLPRLTSLDISGTNLAGRGVAESLPESNAGLFASDIPGLSSRVTNPFQYLGLYETSHDACLRHDIPAKLIAGNANEEQILVAALAFIDRTDMLQKVLNELFHLFRFETCEYVGQALNIVLESMNRHISERHVQISGSATLFYIVKGTLTDLHNSVIVKRRIITTLLNGMCRHKYDDTMMRNGCLTLCQFRIPTDMLFEYERLVEILLHSVHGMQQESFVQRIGIYLLNSLACQVDGQQKVKLGELGAISKMIWLISDRLERSLCDDVLEVAWSTMWNVTDETPSNCRKFLEGKGMEYFLKCLEKFPQKEELLRNIMGLLGNVAEVQELRHYLITREYLSVFSELLDSSSDGIEVSYNAAGVISHIASDGPDVWVVQEPSRNYVLTKMVKAIEKWDINSLRNINYRSFEPILYLVKVYDTPECQQWAVWALANLTKVYPEKYCSLVEKEGGLLLLHELLQHPKPPLAVKRLAMIVIDNCQTFSSDVVQLDG